jgi:hypothetical protein
LADLSFSKSTSEIPLVIDFCLKYVLYSFVHRFTVLLSALVLASWVRVVIVIISMVLRLSATYLGSVLSGCVIEAGGDNPVYPL